MSEAAGNAALAQPVASTEMGSRGWRGPRLCCIQAGPDIPACYLGMWGALRTSPTPVPTMGTLLSFCANNCYVHAATQGLGRVTEEEAGLRGEQDGAQIPCLEPCAPKGGFGVW